MEIVLSLLKQMMSIHVSPTGIHMLADIAGCKEPKKLHKSSVTFFKEKITYSIFLFNRIEQSNKVMFLFFKTHEIRLPL